MLVVQDAWSVSDLVKKKSEINLNPSWQRGPAWKAPRQVLLIDSILRGMDIPKVYLRKLSAPNAYTHDAVDGQQRLRAIWLFRAGELALEYPELLPPIGVHSIAGKTFGDLHKSLRTAFDSFFVSVVEISDATGDEITNLFSRLQMGVSLNPAELRNAIQGPMRHVIETMATTHEFFLNSKIPNVRYKRQDFLTHVFAMAAYQNTRDIKAPDLKSMILEFGQDKADHVLKFTATVGEALNILTIINEKLNFKIVQKWLFVDLCWLIMQWQAENKEFDVGELTENFEAFERLRKEYTSRPETLIGSAESNTKQSRLNKHLYDYIMAFRAQGGTHANLRTRNAALRAFCK